MTAVAGFDCAKDSQGIGSLHQLSTYPPSRRLTTARTVALVAGGTGGHLFPAVAVASELRQTGDRVILITDIRGHAFAPPECFDEIHVIPSSHLRGSIPHKMKALGSLAVGTLKVWRLLRRLKPHMMWGFGGYASIFPLLVGWLQKIPYGIYQADASIGRANHLLAGKALYVATGFHQITGLAPSPKVVCVGFPVRQGIPYTPYTPHLSDNTFRILITGGSQGARFLSRLMPEAVSRLPPHLQAHLVIQQQCVQDLCSETEKSYATTKAQVTLTPFIEDMGQALSKAHLVITRAGASTIGELALTGRPCLLIPYPHAAADHQTHNARQVVAKGGGWLIPENEASAAKIADFLERMMTEPDLLTSAAKKIRNVNTRGAAKALAGLCRNLSPQKQGS